MEASLSKGKTESVDEEGKKTTYILDPLAPEFVPRARLKIVLPVEVLVKIFNFLPNHAIRCGVSLTCKKFQRICQDESLVPVKDLCLFGQPFNQKLFHNFHRISASIHSRICQIYRAAPLEISDNYLTAW